MTALPPTVVDATVTLTWGTAGQYYAYCTIADVAFEFANSDAFTTLTASVKGQEVTNAAIEIQGLLTYAYEMPYTGSDPMILAHLREINAKMACANIIDRYFQGRNPDLSPHAIAKRAWAELMIKDIVTNQLPWAAPFGDATPRAMLPVYDISTLAQITPTPDGTTDTEPIFTIGRSSYRPDVL